MAKNPSNQRKTPKSGEPKRAAVYVDELLPIEERQQELVNILRNVVKNPEHYDGIIVYGSSATDVNEHVKDAIALLTEHGTEVTFSSRRNPQRSGSDDSSFTYLMANPASPTSTRDPKREWQSRSNQRR